MVFVRQLLTRRNASPLKFSGYSILDDLRLFHTRGADHLFLVPAGVYEVKTDFELRISESAFQSPLPIAGERVIHVANGAVHVGSCVRARVSTKSR